MQVKHLEFTPEELDALKNREFFYVKDAATKKIHQLLSELEGNLKSELIGHPLTKLENLNVSMGKIFRGENYRLLPYVVLDFPRYFSKTSVLAFRSMFWWGDGFSFTLHVQGNAWEYYRQEASSKISTLVGKSFYICIAKTPWDYHFESDNYQPLDEFLSVQDALDTIVKLPFLKLSRKQSIDKIKNVIPYGKETFSLLLKLFN